MMQIGQLYKNNQLVVNKVWLAKSILQRMRGLLFRKSLEPDQAMLIRPCSSIHTIGMTYPLDIVFIDAQGIVLKALKNVRPLRMAFAINAYATIEFYAGEIERIGIQRGDYLDWKAA
ncbi:DUF192 domain-containing protein [Methyloradius palustris]|uniref:DUF192 domain-containing protein n=1 Tax=Methyloradius palustris TaxID=2778876 RepID=A0A8D5FZ80_9PROT|nr:DUF192 domain-containing protein [Methyloradius palustris]BCM24827.1 hypothetical protein ZMTM_10860 [Methyloradius palustris]